MIQRHHTPKTRAVAVTCWFTAIVNVVFSTASAQDYTAFRPAPTEGEPDIHVLQYGIFDVRPSKVDISGLLLCTKNQ